MLLIIFMIIFILINIVLLIWANKTLSNTSDYNTIFVKSSIRALFNNIESIEMLEEKRIFLNHKNSMF